MISVSGATKEFIMYCNFLIYNEKVFWEILGEEFKDSLKQVDFNHDDRTSSLVFKNENREADVIMDVIVTLFEDNVL